MIRLTKKTPVFAALLALSAAPTFCEKIIFSADSMTGTVGDTSDSTTLSGEAYVLTESMEISADKIMLFGEEFRFIEAEGAITGKNMEAELEFTCDKLTYDRQTKIAHLGENVHLTDVKNNVTAKAQHIEYNQNTDIAIMQIDIELTQKDNICTGVYAVYRKNEQLLELSGNAQIKQGNDTFRAQEITLDLDSQEITLDGRVKGSIEDGRADEKTEETDADTSAEAETSSETENNTESQQDTADAEETGDEEKTKAEEETDGNIEDGAEDEKQQQTSSHIPEEASAAPKE